MRKLAIVLVPLLIMAFVVAGIGCDEEGAPASTPTVPTAPSNLGAEAISHYTINLWWTDNSYDESGFKIYRNGALLRSVGPNTNTYQDKNLSYATRYSYTVSAHNTYGESSRTTPVSARTLNPPVKVTLDKMGVYHCGESGTRYWDGHGEQYVYIVVTDGITTQELRLPSQGHFYLDNDEVVYVGRTVFSTTEVGDYLRFFVTGWEADGGGFEQVIIQALTGATLDVITGGATVGMELLFGSLLGDFVGSLVGSEDDELGTYEKVWYASDSWGAGKYVDVAKQYLRLWFTISVAGVTS